MKTNKSLKSSVQVSLILLGGSLLGCSSTDGVRKPNRGETRYDYINREQCVQDWGEQCPQTSQGGGTGGLYHYYRYEKNARSKSQTRAVKVVRGGFGSSFRSGNS